MASTPATLAAPPTALEKCASSLSEIHRLLRESSTASSYSSMSATTGTSAEGSPIDAATSHHARRKWHSAIRVIQGLHRFKIPISHRKTHGHSGGVGAVQSKVADVRGSANNVHDVIVDPVYLALKQATGRYTRRGSSTNLESASPSPRNLSQVSLQDSGYAEMTSAKGNPMLGSTPQLDNTGRSTGRRRAPKLSTQMKSLSLDCQDMPPRINSATRSPLRGKLAPRDFRRNGAVNGSSDFSDVERSCSPIVKSRRSSAALMQSRGYIVIHEYAPSYGAPLVLGERVHVVDNGDPDWLHGFRYNDRTEHLITFPATCVAQMHPGEQAMRILQNVFVPEQKFRMYRDQVVFAQPDTLVDGKVTVRTEHNALAPCPLSSLALI